MCISNLLWSEEYGWINGGGEGGREEYPQYSANDTCDEFP